MKNLIKVGVLVFGVAAFTSCDGWGRAEYVPIEKTADGELEFSQISYNFTDASTGPDSHRSYEIRVIDTAVLFTVTSYDSSLLVKEYSLSRDLAGELKTLVNAVDNTSEMTHTGENGSTAEAIVVIGDHGEEAMHLHWNQKETKEVQTLVNWNHLSPPHP